MSQDLSKEQIIEIFEQEYIKWGYLYSGSTSGTILNSIQNRKLIWELVSEGKLQKRDCDGLAFELVIKRRKQLIKEYDLSNVWEKNAPYFYPNQEPYGEVWKVLNSKSLCVDSTEKVK